MQMELIGKVHIVPLVFPQDVTTTGPTFDIVGLKKWNHVTILVMTGTNSKGCTLTLEECDNVTPSNDTAIAFNYRKMSTSDVWGALTAATSSGVTIADGDDNCVYAIELDAAELSDGYAYVIPKLSNPASGNNYFAAIAILSEPRFAEDVPSTVIT